MQALPSYLGTLVDDLDLAVYVMRPDDQECVHVSGRLERLLSSAVDDDTRTVSADPLVNACHPDDRPALDDVLSELSASKSPLSLELRLRGERPRTVVGRWAVVPLDDGVVTVGVLSEEAPRAALDGERLDQLSHDLRTPLNAVLGYAQLLGLTELQEDQRKSVEQVVAGGRRLLAAIESFEARAQAGPANAGS